MKLFKIFHRGVVYAILLALIASTAFGQAVAPTTPPPPPPPPPPQREPLASAVNQNPFVSTNSTPGASLPTQRVDRSETTQERLEILQTALNATLAALQPPPAAPVAASDPAANDRATIAAPNPASAGLGSAFVKKTIAELNQALADVAQALDYVKAHPEINPLPDDPLPVAVPGVIIPPFPSAAMRRGNTVDPNPTLTSVATILYPALRNFLNGTPANSGAIRARSGNGGPVIGTIGGFRDKIIQDVDLAATELRSGITPAGRRGTATPTASAPPTVDATASVPAMKPGSISGVVVDTDGDPAANVLISYISGATTPINDANRVYSGGHAATITDDKGTFILADLPPGTYIVTAALVSAQGTWVLNGSMQPIEVKEGAETKLSTPLEFNSGSSF